MSQGYSHINIDDIEDVAPKYGMGEVGECRVLTSALEAERIGSSFYRMNPGQRHGFGHNHAQAEELYVVLAGSGRVKIDDEIVDLTELDSLRLKPSSVREFEGGPEGMTLLAFGELVKDDGQMDKDFWPAD